MKVTTRKAPDTGLQPASGPVTKPGKSAPVLRPVANCTQLSGSPILTVLTSLNNKQLSGHKKLYRSPFQPPNAHCPHSDCNTSASHLMKSIKARFEPKLRGDLFSHSSDMLTMLWSWCDMHECNETMNHPDSLCLHTHTRSQCMSISTHSVCSMHITCMVSRMSQTTASTISIVHISLPASFGHRKNPQPRMLHRTRGRNRTMWGWAALTASRCPALKTFSFALVMLWPNRTA